MVHFHLSLSGFGTRSLETCTYIISGPKTSLLLSKLIIIIIIVIIIVAPPFSKICKGLQTAHQDLSMIMFPSVFVQVQHREHFQPLLGGGGDTFTTLGEGGGISTTSRDDTVHTTSSSLQKQETIS